MPLKIFRQLLVAAVLLAAAYTSIINGFGLLFFGARTFADFCLFGIPAIALPIAFFSIWRSTWAALLFVLGAILNVGLQVYKFGTTARELLSDKTGFVEIITLAVLLIVLAVTDVLLGSRRVSTQG